MPRKYYAMYADTPDEIAIFQSARQRNDWVNYRDPHSIAVPGYYDGKRIAIPRIYAEYIVGKDTLRSGKDTQDFHREKDDYNDGITWIVRNNGHSLTKAEMLDALTPPWERCMETLKTITNHSDARTTMAYLG